jgi:DNA-binding response OmpR family regulator
MKLLIVEDDVTTADFMKTGFEAASYAVDVAHNGSDGSYIARVNHYDAIIIDYSLPSKNGLKVCEEIRASGSVVPILFLSAIGEITKKVDALERGADDYMTKPFSFEELQARIRALTRRPHRIETSIITTGDLSLDTERQVAVRGDTAIYLTRKEYTLLEYLMRNQGTILSRGMIMEHVWNADSDPFSNTIEAHVLNLRKKVNLGKRKDIIRNVPGRGYTIDVE